MAIFVNEKDFTQKLNSVLSEIDNDYDFVTGPGRSGAIASVYISHKLSIPFAPYGVKLPENSNVLIVDTVMQSGKTIKKAKKQYAYTKSQRCLAVFSEKDRLIFWYEKRFS